MLKHLYKLCNRQRGISKGEATAHKYECTIVGLRTQWHTAKFPREKEFNKVVKGLKQWLSDEKERALQKYRNHAIPRETIDFSLCRTTKTCNCPQMTGLYYELKVSGSKVTCKK